MHCAGAGRAARSGAVVACHGEAQSSRANETRLADQHVYDLPDLLRAGDLLVMNDTKVIPARFFGMRGAVRVEILLHKKEMAGCWLAFARPGKRLRVGDVVVFGEDFAAEIAEKREGGEVLIRFCADGSHGTPLPSRGGVGGGGLSETTGIGIEEDPHPLPPPARGGGILLHGLFQMPNSLVCWTDMASRLCRLI